MTMMSKTMFGSIALIAIDFDGILLTSSDAMGISISKAYLH